MNTYRKPVVLVDPTSHEAVSFGTQAAAAAFLNRDASTVSRAVSGDRGIRSVSGYTAVRVQPTL